MEPSAHPTLRTRRRPREKGGRGYTPTPALLLLVLLLGGCEPSDAASGHAVRDSAGVRISESHVSAWAQGPGTAWTVGAAPSLQIGVVDGADEYQFSTIVGALRLADGRILVADRQAAQLRFYGADGTFLTALGGRGSGPGEFANLALIAPYRGDSIAAWDAATRRLTLIDGGGRVGRTLTLGRVLGPGGDDTPQGAGPMTVRTVGGLAGVFEDGTLLVTPTLTLQMDPSQPFRPITGYLRYSPEGDLLGTVATFLGPEMLVTSPAALRGAPPPPRPPFPPTIARTIQGKRIYLAVAEQYQIEVRHADGTLEQLIRAHHRDHTVSDPVREAYRAFRREGAAQDPAELAEVERQLRETTFPETLPPLSELLVDAEAHLWVRDYRLAWKEGGPESWSVFDPEGRLLGTVETPERLRVRQIGRDFVLGVWTDALGVPFVRVHPLTRP